MGVSKNSGTPKLCILYNKVFHCFHHPFWGENTPIYRTTHIPVPWMVRPPLKKAEPPKAAEGTEGTAVTRDVKAVFPKGFWDKDGVPPCGDTNRYHG